MYLNIFKNMYFVFRPLTYIFTCVSNSRFSIMPVLVTYNETFPLTKIILGLIPKVFWVGILFYCFSVFQWIWQWYCAISLRKWHLYQATKMWIPISPGVIIHNKLICVSSEIKYFIYELCSLSSKIILSAVCANWHINMCIYNL